MLYGDSRKMLKELEDMFNEISGAATKNVWSFVPIKHGDTTALLNHLNELRIIHKKRIDELDSITKS